MSTEVFEFPWRVTDTGYEVAKVIPIGTDKKKPMEVLTDGVAVGTRYSSWHYDPLQTTTGLFRTFAQIPPTKEGIVAFANKYGLLGTSEVTFPLPQGPPKGGSYIGNGEPVSAWLQRISTMRRAIDLWDMAKGNDVSELNRYLTYDPGEPPHVKGWKYNSHPGLQDGEWPLPPGYSLQLLEHAAVPFIQPGEVALAATLIVQRWINKNMADEVAPRLLYNVDRRRQVLRIVPKSLLGAMWLQFAQAIDGDKHYRPCKDCGTWFEVSLDAFRINRLFCSDRCKSRDYRRRKDRAVQLRAKGRPAREIAKELETDIETIRKWTATKKS